MSRHPVEPVDLSAYHDGALEETERRRVEGHLAVCPMCREKLADYARLGDALRSSSEPPIPLTVDLRVRALIRAGAEPQRRRLLPVLWAPRPILAALVLAALLTVALMAGVPIGYQGSGPLVAAAYLYNDQGEPAIEVQFDGAVDHDSVARSVQIEPTVALNVSWRNDSTMVVKPARQLQPSGSYTLKLKPKGADSTATPVALHFAAQVPASPVALATQPPHPTAVAETPAANLPVAGTSTAATPSGPTTPTPTAAGSNPAGAPMTAPGSPTARGSGTPVTTPGTKTPAASAGGVAPTPTATRTPATGTPSTPSVTPSATPITPTPTSQPTTPVVVTPATPSTTPAATASTPPSTPEPTPYQPVATSTPVAALTLGAATPTPEDASPTPEGQSAPSPTETPAFASTPTAEERETTTSGATTTPAPDATATPTGTPPLEEAAPPPRHGTPTPTATPPSEDATPPTATSTATATPTPAPMQGLGIIYQQVPSLERTLGTARSRELPVELVRQTFERGTMLSRSDTREVFVLRMDGSWLLYRDSWQQGEALSNAGSLPPGLLAPIQGLGKLWRQEADLRQSIGWATAPQQSLPGSVQEFTNGWALRTSDHVIYVVYQDGSWQSFHDPSPDPTPTATPTIVPSP